MWETCAKHVVKSLEVGFFGLRTLHLPNSTQNVLPNGLMMFANEARPTPMRASSAQLGVCLGFIQGRDGFEAKEISSDPIWT